MPAFYRIWFTWVDPIIAGHAVYMDFFTPDTVLNAFIPDSPRNPAHDMLFHQMGGGMLHIAFVSAVLLRYTSDVKVWRIVQGGILLVDLVGLGSLWHTLGRQGRRHPAGWRFEDWACVVILGFVTLLRLSFLAGLGFPRRRAAARVKRS